MAIHCKSPTSLRCFWASLAMQECTLIHQVSSMILIKFTHQCAKLCFVNKQHATPVAISPYGFADASKL